MLGGALLSERSGAPFTTTAATRGATARADVGAGDVGRYYVFIVREMVRKDTCYRSTACVKSHAAILSSVASTTARFAKTLACRK
jgi:hypothetical protein